jgi:hypothetical protein
MRPEEAVLLYVFHLVQVSLEGLAATVEVFFGLWFLSRKTLGEKTPPFAGAKRRGRNREEAREIG